MSDKCPFCGAGIRENLHTLKTFTCNTKHSLFSEEWVYWQSVECKDRQIASLTASRDQLDQENQTLRNIVRRLKPGEVNRALRSEEEVVLLQSIGRDKLAEMEASRDRWKEVAAAQKVIIAYEHRNADYGINAMIQAYGDRDKAVAALKEAGEWEI